MQAGLLTAVTFGLLGALAGLLVARPARSALVGAGIAVSGAGAVVAGIAAMTGQVAAFAAPDVLPLSGVVFALDPLGGAFLAVTGGVAVATGIYGIGYCRAGLDGRLVQTMLPLFVLAMMLVPAAASVGTFLLCWELMALTSLLLVLAEHRRRPDVASAGALVRGDDAPGPGGHPDRLLAVRRAGRRWHLRRATTCGTPSFARRGGPDLPARAHRFRFQGRHRAAARLAAAGASGGAQQRVRV